MSTPVRNAYVLYNRDDCVLVELPSDINYEGCNHCVRVHAVSGLFGPECREDSWDCGYSTDRYEWEERPTVWMLKVDAMVYRLTGDARCHRK